jgi:isopentenyl-diphosphate Delta-isomerase
MPSRDNRRGNNPLLAWTSFTAMNGCLISVSNYMEDIFDIVDEHDQVIGNGRRSIIHAQKLRHRAIHILLRNACGEVFLQKRSPLKDKNPNRWDTSCSGHVDSGEDYDTAAVRELYEELGVRMDLASLQKMQKFEAVPETGMEFVWIYHGHHDGPFTLCPHEISDGRYWTLAEVDAGMAEQPHNFSGAFRFIWGQTRHLR